MQLHNLVAYPGRIAPVMLWSGQMANTVKNMVSAREGVDVPDSLKDETGFVTQLQGLVAEFMLQEMLARDEVSRSNAMRRDKADQKIQKRDVYHVGDVVSHNGVKWKIVELCGEIGRPVTTKMVSVNDPGKD